jgi:hypothetical protein
MRLHSELSHAPVARGLDQMRSCPWVAAMEINAVRAAPPPVFKLQLLDLKCPPNKSSRETCTAFPRLLL